ncbi:MAG: hypothetical protein H6730_16135 [Deltaproteobacteria bacterium]|nr:hypothetical protein [Deltaproteobacteria bacterium]
MKRELGPIGERVKHVDGQDIRWIRKLADDRRSGTKPTGRQLTDLSERLGIERAEVRRVIDDLAGLPPPVLSARARRIVAEAPELRSGLEALAASDAPVDLQQRTLRSVERAVTEERAVIDREHLRGWPRRGGDQQGLDHQRAVGSDARARLGAAGGARRPGDGGDHRVPGREAGHARTACGGGR